MMIEYVSIVDILKNKRGKHKYIYETFGYNNYEYFIFYTHHKYLFNIDPNHSRIRITLTLIQKMVSKRIVYDT